MMERALYSETDSTYWDGYQAARKEVINEYHEAVKKMLMKEETTHFCALHNDLIAAELLNKPM